MRIAIVLALAACGHRGEYHYHYAVEPPAAAAGEHSVSVSRVSGIALPGARDRAIPRLWVELALANAGAADWNVHASELVLVPEGMHAAGLAVAPNILPSAPVEAAIIVEPGGSRTVWARFDDVHAQNREAARAGVDDPVPLAIRIDGNELVLSDPLRGSPIWTPPHWPYFATFGFGFGGAFGSDAGVRRGGLTSDVTLSLHRRFGEFDIGAIGMTSAGVDLRGEPGTPMQAAGLATLTTGLTTGYTTPIGDHFYLRSALAGLVAHAGHGDVGTTSAWLAGELQIGLARRGVYPVRDRPTAYTFGWYARAEARVASLSQLAEPFGFAISLGLVMRGGS